MHSTTLKFCYSSTKKRNRYLHVALVCCCQTRGLCHETLTIWKKNKWMIQRAEPAILEDHSLLFTNGWLCFYAQNVSGSFFFFFDCELICCCLFLFFLFLFYVGYVFIFLVIVVFRQIYLKERRWGVQARCFGHSITKNKSALLNSCDAPETVTRFETQLQSRYSEFLRLIFIWLLIIWLIFFFFF